eukprot:3117961-Rhodomonas_salina.2
MRSQALTRSRSWRRGVATVICGVIMLGLPISVLSSNFNEKYAEVKKVSSPPRTRSAISCPDRPRNAHPWYHAGPTRCVVLTFGCGASSRRH